MKYFKLIETTKEELGENAGMIFAPFDESMNLVGNTIKKDFALHRMEGSVALVNAQELINRNKK